MGGGGGGGRGAQVKFDPYKKGGGKGFSYGQSRAQWGGGGGRVFTV